MSHDHFLNKIKLYHKNVFSFQLSHDVQNLVNNHHCTMNILILYWYIINTNITTEHKIHKYCTYRIHISQLFCENSLGDVFKLHRSLESFIFIHVDVDFIQDVEPKFYIFHWKVYCYKCTTYNDSKGCDKHLETSKNPKYQAYAISQHSIL